MNLLNLEKLFPLILTALLMLIIIFNFMNPSYAVEFEHEESESVILGNFFSFNWIPKFHVHHITFMNPFEESEEIKTISGILEEGSKFEYVRGVNSSASRLPIEGGDCWAMSDWLYYKIKKTGVECRIIQYETSLAAYHRSVQIKSNGEWIDLPYGKYGFDSRFAAAHNKPGFFVYEEG